MRGAFWVAVAAVVGRGMTKSGVRIERVEGRLWRTECRASRGATDGARRATACIGPPTPVCRGALFGRVIDENGRAWDCRFLQIG